jgi:hypothetical protein
MNILKSIDDALIRFAQDAYLWLWDRTGVYVGTVVFLAYSVGVATLRGAIMSSILFVISAITLALPRYFAQGKSLGLLNAMQRAWAASRLRMVATVFLCLLTLVSLDHLSEAIGLVSIISSWVFACVQVRDRKPPENLHLAAQAAGGRR